METDQKNPVSPDELPENSQELTSHDDEIQTLEAAAPINPNTRVSLGRDNTNEAIQAFPIYPGRGRGTIIICTQGVTSQFIPETNLIRVACMQAELKETAVTEKSQIFLNSANGVILIPGTVEYFTVIPGTPMFVSANKDNIIYINA